jgi:DNA-binding beta-propeller fold protein YncE
MGSAHRHEQRLGLRLGRMALLVALLALASGVLSEPATAGGDGSLARLAGKGGCVTVTDQRGCARGRAIGRPRDVAVSPGGGSVYVTSARSDAVAVFRRSLRTGALRQLRGHAGCVRRGGAGGCEGARALADPSAIVVSPDGENVYVASFGSHAIAVFGRSRRTGALQQLPGRAACVRNHPGGRCRNGRALTRPSTLALGAGGRFLYVGSADGIAVFRRNVRTGALSQPRGANGCVTAEALDGCAIGRAVRQVSDIALDRDGDNLYTASSPDNAVAVFDLANGVPRQPAGPAGCISHLGEGGCTAPRTLLGAFGLAASPSGAQLYATAEFNGAVAILARDPASGALSQPPGSLGCIRDGGGIDCAVARFMGHPDEIVVSHDGRNAYVRAERSDIVVLRRDRATGELSQLPGKAGCVSARLSDCTATRPLITMAMALSRDGRNLYVASGEGNRTDRILVFRRAR